MNMNHQRKIDEYRVRFSKAPVGHWFPASGTFNNVMGQDWYFYSDGTGKYIDYGPFGSIYSETRFEWREKGERTIEFRETESIGHDFDDDDEGEDEKPTTDEEGVMDWVTIKYDVRVVQHDAGSEVALYDVGQVERGIQLEETGFWGSDPLSYVGRI
jgi:hypothetical protein